MLHVYINFTCLSRTYINADIHLLSEKLKKEYRKILTKPALHTFPEEQPAYCFPNQAFEVGTVFQYYNNENKIMNRKWKLRVKISGVLHTKLTSLSQQYIMIFPCTMSNICIQTSFLMNHEIEIAQCLFFVNVRLCYECVKVPLWNR